LGSTVHRQAALHGLCLTLAPILRWIGCHCVARGTMPTIASPGRGQQQTRAVVEDLQCQGSALPAVVGAGQCFGLLPTEAKFLCWRHRGGFVASPISSRRRIDTCMQGWTPPKPSEAAGLPCRDIAAARPPSPIALAIEQRIKAVCGPVPASSRARPRRIFRGPRWAWRSSDVPLTNAWGLRAVGGQRKAAAPVLSNAD